MGADTSARPCGAAVVSHVDSTYPKWGCVLVVKYGKTETGTRCGSGPKGITEATCLEREGTPGLGGPESVLGRSRVGQSPLGSAGSLVVG
jgi:hypothetical protein